MIAINLKNRTFPRNLRKYAAQHKIIMKLIKKTKMKHIFTTLNSFIHKPLLIAFALLAMSSNAWGTWPTYSGTCNQSGYVVYDASLELNTIDSEEINLAGPGQKVTFEASAGSGAIVYTGAGNDTITIKGGNKQQIHTGAGTDTIIVSGGTGHKIYLDEGTNKLTLSNSKATIFTGYAATDKITINWKKGKTNNYTIDTPQTISNATVKLDTLRISGIKSDAFKFAENNNGALVMSTGDGRITISNFDEAWKWDYFGLSFANGITFDDKTLSLDEISKKISIV